MKPASCPCCGGVTFLNRRAFRVCRNCGYAYAEGAGPAMPVRGVDELERAEAILARMGAGKPVTTPMPSSPAPALIALDPFADSADPSETARALAAATQTGGLLHVTTPHFGHWRAPRAWTDAPDRRFWFTPKGLTMLFERMNLRVERRIPSLWRPWIAATFRHTAP